MANESWYAEARRRWGKKAVRIKGDGQYALLTWCRVLEVTLLPTKAEAEELKENVDRTGCGGGCFGANAHEIIDLSIPDN